MASTRIFWAESGLRISPSGWMTQCGRANSYQTGAFTTVAPAEAAAPEQMTLEERVRWLIHELEYAKQEVEFLKKIANGEYGGPERMGIEAPARVKYALIREAAERDGNMLNVSWMCRIAG